MTAERRKIVTDLRPHGARTLLVVLAIALGVAGFGGLLATEAILSRELDASYRATNPASAVLTLDRADRALARELRARGLADDAEPRRVLHGRLKARPGDWRPLVLFVLDDFASVRLSRVVPQRGAWPPGPGEVLIERDAFATARTPIGAAVPVETGAGIERALRVVGTAHDVGQAQARMEQIVYGYVSADTLPLLGEEPFLDQLLVLAPGDASDAAHVRAATDDVGRWLEANGRTVYHAHVPEPGRHPHADLTSLLLRVQSAFGLAALALAGVLVAGLLTARMAAERRSIGVLKAIGATRWRIARLYLAQAAVLGAAGLALGVPAGLWGARVLVRTMADFLNIDVASFAVPPRVFLLQAVVGLLVPVLAAAWPVWRGTAVSVRDALSDAGVSPGAFGRSALDRALVRVSGPGRPVLLAVRNVLRRPGRMAPAFATLAIAGLCFVAALSVRGSLARTLDRMFDAQRFDLTASFAAPVPREAAERAALRVAGVVAAEGWRTAGGCVAGDGDACGEPFAVVAAPPASRLLAWVPEDGRGLEAGDADAVVVNTRLRARQRAPEPGSSVRLKIGDRVVTARVVGMHREPFAPPTAYVPLALLESAAPSALGAATNSLRLDVEPSRLDPESQVGVRAALEEELAREGLRASAMTGTRDRRRIFDAHFEMIAVFLVIAAGALGTVGGLGLATATSLNVLERRRELAVLRAIGASPRAVGVLVVAEALVVSLAAWAASVAVAWPLSRAVSDALVRALMRSPLDFALDARGPVGWLVLSVALTVAASAVPAWRAGRIAVRSALADE